jgi:type I restriction enzyme R subunit
VSGVIEDLDVLLGDFKKKMAAAKRDYLEAGEGGADEKLERLVYGRFLAPEARKQFYEAYKEIEALWEILSPSPELRDDIEAYKELTKLYAAVRGGHERQVGFIADLAYKTKRLIEERATQEGLGKFTKSVTFDVKTLESLRGEKGPDEGKVFNLVRGLQQEMDENADTAPVLQPLKDRAERILKDLEDRKTTGIAAMEQLAQLAADKELALKAARESGLSPRAFAVYWSLREDPALKKAGVDPMALAREAESLLARFPNAAVNADEERRFRAALYKPLLVLSKDRRAGVVERAASLLLDAGR